MATSNGAKSAATPSTNLEAQYPVNTSWEFVLQSQENVEGSIYCTDEISQTVVLQTTLSHTVLATEIRVIHATHIVRATQQKTTDANDSNPLSAPLPKIQKKVLEEREKKSLKMAEESLRHINEKVSEGLVLCRRSVLSQYYVFFFEKRSCTHGSIYFHFF